MTAPVTAGRINAVGLFCEFLKQGINGQDTLVGILPDSVNVPSFPGQIPILGIYVRLVFDPDDSFDGAEIVLTLPGTHVVKSPISQELIDQSRKTVKELGHPVVTLVTRMSFGPVVVEQPGRALLEFSSGGRTHVLSALNFVKG